MNRLPLVFGGLPSAEEREQYSQLHYYRNGQFQNLSPTSQFAPGSNVLQVIRDSLKKQPNRTPSNQLPIHLDFPERHTGSLPKLTWFGHSSYLLQVEGLNLLVDPVFSRRASFTQAMGPASYPLTTPFRVEQLPPIDYLLLTHDHYDHLDFAAINTLKQQVQHFFAPLGVGAHLRRWGIEPQRITQLAWWQSTRMNEKLELIATPARHFSGRWVKRNQSLWASYILRSNAFCLYLGGDSGYDSHFKTIGEQYGPFDLVILENGQYNRHWPFIHMHPEETAQAAVDLKAKALLPVHWGKFSLAMHAWNEPIERVVKKAATLQQQIVIPYFGEAIEIGSVYPLREWWQ